LITWRCGHKEVLLRSKEAGVGGPLAGFGLVGSVVMAPVESMGSDGGVSRSVVEFYIWDVQIDDRGVGLNKRRKRGDF